MQTFLHGRDLIGDLDFSREEVETVLDVAFDLKRKRALNELTPILRDRVLAMLFFFSSTRTRGSFEAGMAHLGGHAAFIESRTTQISHGDTPKEIGEIFGRYFDGIAIRHVDWGIGNKYINDVAKASRVPVLNMQCDIWHPFQCLADLMTIMEKKGRDLRKKKMVVSWAYAASYQKPISVPQSLVRADAALRYGCCFGASAGVQADARGDGGCPRTGQEVRHLIHRDRFDGGGLQGCRYRLRQILGCALNHQRCRRRRQDHQEVRELDHRREKDEAGKTGCNLHAPTAG